jgi:dihydrofolate reductase
MYQVIVAGCQLNDSDKLGIGIDLGNNPTMSWSLKSDMDHFRNTTTGHIIFMGGKTWDSLPFKFRPLPNRINIVLSSNATMLNLTKDGLYPNPITNVNMPGLTGTGKANDYIHFVSSLEEGYEFYKKCVQDSKYADKELFVIGGETVYTQMVEKYPQYLDKLFLTTVYKSLPCNKYFPVKKYLDLPHKLVFDTPIKTDINTMSKEKEEVKFKLEVYRFIH